MNTSLLFSGLMLKMVDKFIFIFRAYIELVHCINPSLNDETMGQNRLEHGQR